MFVYIAVSIIYNKKKQMRKNIKIRNKREKKKDQEECKRWNQFVSLCFLLLFIYLFCGKLLIFNALTKTLMFQ